MSVLIKGMEIPSVCNNCGFYRIYEENWNVICNANDRLVKNKWNDIVCRAEKPDWYLTEKPDWCPLVEVPTPHGRLMLRTEDGKEYEIDG